MQKGNYKEKFRDKKKNLFTSMLHFYLSVTKITFNYFYIYPNLLRIILNNVFLWTVLRLLKKNYVITTKLKEITKHCELTISKK